MNTLLKIDTNATVDFFSQNYVDNPIRPWDFYRNENEVLKSIDHVAPAVSPVKLTSAVDSSPSNSFTEHQSWDNFVLNQITPTVNTRMASSVEAYLVRLQAVCGQQLTVDQAILILRHYIWLANPALHVVNSGHSASPSMPFVPPVEVAPTSPDVVNTEPGASASISMEIPAAFDAESTLGACDMGSLRRIFLDGDRIKVECLWPNCGRTLMKDNHPRHVRECHLHARRGTLRTNSG
ncbi:uncharacterized protein EDB91DRAFT_1126254 [Suillus paluster]|uniref:uncharacterized protein n=1 Tax=Suillus paluster TaxID=48578 RepID=UPI001B875CA1|nr:uncharacterized protein EDB91DRAFT_1126254 [Suillus paluster]KAG1743212.1 hypothetical protein EDB91DRAFT_1126254 [Suillus paluster]